MERIDHSNYEAWLLDQMEGRLSAARLRELEAFLLAHPELRPDDEFLPRIDAEAGRMSVDEKDALKRMLPPLDRVAQETLDDHLVASFEGDLTAEQQKALDAFLQERPELAREQRLMAVARVGGETVAMPGRASLHRALPPEGLVVAQTLDDHLVARLEGDLSGDQELALDAHLAAHTSAQRQWRVMQAARIAKEPVVYPEKASLRRGGRVLPLFPARTVRWAAAASVALLLGAAWWFNKPVSAPLAADDAPPTKSGVVKESAPVDPGAARRIDEAPQPDSSPLGTGSERAPRPQPDGGEPTQPQTPLREREPMEPAPMRERPLLAQGGRPEPKDAAQAPTQPQPEEDLLLASVGTAPAPSAEDRSLGQALTGVLREHVLDQPAEERRPLDGGDAVAAIDRGLRAVGGNRAGFAVQRDAQGKGRGFELRLGRHLAVTASR